MNLPNANLIFQTYTQCCFHFKPYTANVDSIESELHSFNEKKTGVSHFNKEKHNRLEYYAQLLCTSIEPTMNPIAFVYFINRGTSIELVNFFSCQHGQW